MRRATMQTTTRKRRREEDTRTTAATTTRLTNYHDLNTRQAQSCQIRALLQIRMTCLAITTWMRRRRVPLRRRRRRRCDWAFLASWELQRDASIRLTFRCVRVLGRRRTGVEWCVLAPCLREDPGEGHQVLSFRGTKVEMATGYLALRCQTRRGARRLQRIRRDYATRRTRHQVFCCIGHRVRQRVSPSRVPGALMPLRRNRHRHQSTASRPRRQRKRRCVFTASLLARRRVRRRTNFDLGRRTYLYRVAVARECAILVVLLLHWSASAFLDVRRLFLPYISFLLICL